MATRKTGQYVHTETFQYKEFKKGDLVFFNPHFAGTSFAYECPIDHERIYKVVSFTPPDRPNPNMGEPNGQVVLANRLNPVASGPLELATPELIRQECAGDQKKIDYLLKYLDWLALEDQFGVD